MGPARTKIEEVTVRSTAREQLIDVTAEVQEAVARTGVEDGVVWVFSTHTTAAVTVQENADPDLRVDILSHLRAMVPREGFRHSEGNADAHIKASLTGASQAVPLQGGRLVLGTWQAIYLLELDGPRQRRLLVKALAG